GTGGGESSNCLLWKDLGARRRENYDKRIFANIERVSSSNRNRWAQFFARTFAGRQVQDRSAGQRKQSPSTGNAPARSQRTRLVGKIRGEGRNSAPEGLRGYFR